MDSQTILKATHTALAKLVADFLQAMDGIPAEDLNSWKPAAEHNGGGEMNTFAALAVHTATAGHWMIAHQVFGLEFPRDRELEFNATATRAEIDELFADFLSSAESVSDVDLTALPAEIRPAMPDATKLDWLLHVVDHTALHLGHVQIQRQAWLAERAETP